MFEGWAPTGPTRGAYSTHPVLLAVFSGEGMKEERTGELREVKE